MDEINRIIDKGIVNKEYLKPDIRYDFYCDEERKKVWAVELDLLFEFDKVCNNNRLTYCLGYGSLLGAVRHGGFIPWDDDIDIFMPRDDYEQLKLKGNEFRKPYFLQCHESESESYWSHMKLRNGNTCCINLNYRFLNINWGMSIDIFPLDDTDPRDGIGIFNEIKKLNIDNSSWMMRNNPYLNEINNHRVTKYNGNADDDYKKIQELAQCKNGTLYCGVNVCTMYDYKKNTYNKKWFDNIIYIEFESTKVPVPEGYEDVLKTTYGNYLELPPLDMRGTWHIRNFCRPDISYRDIIGQIRANEY